jgi:hypothetical protein
MRRLEALLESQEMADRGEVAWDRWEQERAVERTPELDSDPDRAAA